MPLKKSLQKAERRNKIRAFLLVFPLLVFIIITFVVPIGDMLLRSYDDSHINTVFPRTFEEFLGKIAGFHKNIIEILAQEGGLWL